MYITDSYIHTFEIFLMLLTVISKFSSGFPSSIRGEKLFKGAFGSIWMDLFGSFGREI
jgi:hypothetical protein